MSYTELHERNRLRAMKFRKVLDHEFLKGQVGIEALIAQADEPHRRSALRR
jgi:hypothetical protein